MNKSLILGVRVGTHLGGPGGLSPLPRRGLAEEQPHLVRPSSLPRSYGSLNLLATPPSERERYPAKCRHEEERSERDLGSEIWGAPEAELVPEPPGQPHEL